MIGYVVFLQKSTFWIRVLAYIVYGQDIVVFGIGCCLLVFFVIVIFLAEINGVIGMGNRMYIDALRTRYSFFTSVTKT